MRGERGEIGFTRHLCPTAAQYICVGVLIHSCILTQALWTLYEIYISNIYIVQIVWAERNGSNKKDHPWFPTNQSAATG